MNVVDHNEPTEKQKEESSENKLLSDYKEKLKTFYDENIRPKVGAIVMNANPFTFGHRFLVETALNSCDYLIVFVVEEDKSEIPFKDRFALVKEIDRCKTESGDIVSASAVRKLAKARDFEKLKTLAPPATIRYLKKKYS